MRGDEEGGGEGDGEESAREEGRKQKVGIQYAAWTRIMDARELCNGCLL